LIYLDFLGYLRVIAKIFNMSPQGNNNNAAESFLRNHVYHVGVQIPFEVYPTQISELRVVSPGGTEMKEELVLSPNPAPTNHVKCAAKPTPISVNIRLNKFVRRLHEMLAFERESGVVEWRRGLLILHSIDEFTKVVLPKYFNTRNFKTFRRQLNYYGFVHVRSFSVNGSTTTALWVNQELADTGSDSISSVLKLKRVEPSEASKTPEGRRERKNEAVCSVEVDGLVEKKSFMNQRYSAANHVKKPGVDEMLSPPLPIVVHCNYHEQPSPPLFEHTVYPTPVTPRREEVFLAVNTDVTPATTTNNAAIPYFTQFEHNISSIDQAAGLLLSLSRATV